MTDIFEFKESVNLTFQTNKQQIYTYNSEFSIYFAKTIHRPSCEVYILVLELLVMVDTKVFVAVIIKVYIDSFLLHDGHRGLNFYLGLWF